MRGQKEVASPVLVSARHISWGLSGERWRNNDNSSSKSKMKTMGVTW